MKKLLIIIGVIVGLNTSIVAGPIHDAASNGDIDEIKSLLNIGVSVDHKDKYGRTALMVSIVSGHFETADFLISVGANVSHQDKRGRTPLMSAREVQIASLLINNGAEVGKKDFEGDTAMHRLANFQSDSLAPVLNLLIASGADVNETNIYGRTPMDIADDEGLDSDDLFFQQLQQAGAKSGLVLLQEKVDRLSTGTTNPTDEWPRKMWEIDLEIQVDDLYGVLHGIDNSVLVTDIRSPGKNGQSYWIASNGKHYELKDKLHNESPIYISNNSLIYGNSGNIIGLFRNQNEVVKRTFRQTNMRDPVFRSANFPIVQVSWEGTKITGWDFTPPTSTAPKPDDGNGGGNGGGNETVNSRLIIKTAGPDISLATDGKLGGAAELQKSNDLRSWRRLGDVPAEASEVLVTPRESGNEFYRLKKN
jgi:ankyrin repeat protein